MKLEDLEENYELTNYFTGWSCWKCNICGDIIDTTFREMYNHLEEHSKEDLATIGIE